MKLLADRVALVTGAAGGIGRAAVEVFVREGARVIAADLPDGDGERIVEDLANESADITFVPTDISSREQVDALVSEATKKFGRLDAAFNNAGITGPLHPLVDYPEEEFEQVLGVNVRGTWYCMQAEIKAMIESGGGAIVNTSSSLGEVGAAGTAAYTMSKHAVLGMTRAAALDTATLGIRINAVLPGVIDTQMPERLMAGAGGKEAFIPSMPIGRLGEPIEIAEAVAWLCSDRASLATGAGFAVDGGYLAH